MNVLLIVKIYLFMHQLLNFKFFWRHNTIVLFNKVKSVGRRQMPLPCLSPLATINNNSSQNLTISRLSRLTMEKDVLMKFKKKYTLLLAISFICSVLEGLKITVNKTPEACHAYAYLLEENFELSEFAKNNQRGNNLDLIFEKKEFTGKLKDFLQLISESNRDLDYTFYLGLGNHECKEHNFMESVRRSIGTIVNTIKKHKINACNLIFPNNISAWCDPSHLIKQASIAAYLVQSHDDFY